MSIFSIYLLAIACFGLGAIVNEFLFNDNKKQ